MTRPRGFAVLLDSLDLPPPLRADLAHRMAARERGYHGMGHLAVLWDRHRRLARGGPMAGARIARLVAAAIAYHDAVLVPGARDNEIRSAALWRRAARRLPGFTPAEIAWVADTILATADHLACPVRPGRLARARRWMVELDLTPIGEEPALFRRNGRQLRQEARHLSDARYDAEQTAFLDRLRRAPRMFREPRLHGLFEARARRNIAQEIQRAARRAALRAGGPGPAGG